MAFTEFNTAALPREQRFDWWCEVVGRGVAPTRITSDGASDFTGSVGSLGLGPLQLTTMAFPALRSERTAQLVRRGDPETYELTLVLGGSMEVSQGRNDAALHAGDFALWTSSRPYRGRAVSTPETGAARAVILHLPRTLVPVPESRLDRLFASTLSARSGIARILADHLISVAREAPLLDESDGERLGLASLDLAAGLLASRADAQDRVPPETRHQVLRARIDVFIQDHLTDPQLGPDAIAAHHHISVRLLHQLFRPRGETVSAAIRRQRLERCHGDLTDPRLLSVPVHAIGARWGLKSPESFNRSFRAAYGMPPGEHRRTALGVRSGTTLRASQANDG
ncbi:helix-turn-helix domain-containing protein [Streptomyces sp. NBC_00536]|uniref:AraC-like ligand-binding domain-containing protein n=1 Tax=Streptomyces sp. NBC_00536 TaxID=2975769 RepID=UPI002E817EDB|nr:helix-turn-helix domain-containing protein [Streptomyces sp. NBC_00536]WUC83196.1 helix-turn-helix domain-containing protein [Streptomyces sp. NBC_00536]